jgi:sugar/nucleoside kinase (ribokinase family)
VLGIGENSLDRVCVADAQQPFGSKLSLFDYSEHAGGQIATAVLACARLELNCAYVGAVGDDPDAETVLTPLGEAGVDITGVKRVRGVRTRQAVILVEKESGERSVLEYRAPGLALAVADLKRAAIASARALLLDGGDPEVALWAARVAREAGTAVVLDVERSSSALKKLLRFVDFPIVSEGYAESWKAGGAQSEALCELAAHGARLAVATLGARGALGRCEDRVIESAAYRVSTRDTTGAGDAFRGGFLWALLRGMGAEAALRTANALAAMNCRALGAQGGLATLAELDAFQRDSGPASPVESDGCGA